MRARRDRDIGTVCVERRLQNTIQVPRVFSFAERVVVGAVEQNRRRSSDYDLAVVGTQRPVQRHQTHVGTN